MSHWLDKIIEEQAAHYGLTVEQHARLMNGAAKYQELIDKHQVEEPTSEEMEIDRTVDELIRQWGWSRP